jgi:predicted nucleic acid-binding protein
MRRGAIFDSSFWVHAVYLDIVDFLLADYTLLCPRAVAKELGGDNPTSLRLKEYLSAKTIQLATPRTAKIVLYGDGERAAINLALERQLVLLIDDWRPYEAARAAEIAVVNTPAYLVQLYHQGRLPLERTLGDIARLTRRGTLKPEWLHAALTLVSELRQKGKDQ